MNRILKTISLITILFLSASYAFSAKTPVYLNSEAGKGKLTNLDFWNYLRNLSPEQVKQSGFKSDFEMANAKLGKPFRVYMIDDMENLKYRGNDIYSILSQSDLWLYPIIVERNGVDRIVSLLRVVVYVGRYTPKSICCTATAGAFDKISSIWSERQGFELTVMKIQKKTDANFVIVENKNIQEKNINASIVALPSMYSKFKKLTAYDFGKAHPILQSFSMARLKRQGLDPYAIQGVNPPKKIAKVSVKPKKSKKSKEMAMPELKETKLFGGGNDMFGQQSSGSTGAFEKAYNPGKKSTKTAGATDPSDMMKGMMGGGGGDGAPEGFNPADMMKGIMGGAGGDGAPEGFNPADMMKGMMGGGGGESPEFNPADMMKNMPGMNPGTNNADD